VMHEIGHALGFEHGDADLHAVMDEDLDPGVRRVLDAIGFDADPDQPITDAMLRELAQRAARLEAQAAPGFDLGAGQGAGAGINWSAGADDGWSSSYSPYATGNAGNGKGSGGNFSDFLVKVLKGGTAASGTQGPGFDSLGNSLFGTKPGKGKSPR